MYCVLVFHVFILFIPYSEWTTGVRHVTVTKANEMTLELSVGRGTDTTMVRSRHRCFRRSPLIHSQKNSILTGTTENSVHEYKVMFEKNKRYLS